MNDDKPLNIIVELPEGKTLKVVQEKKEVSVARANVSYHPTIGYFAVVKGDVGEMADVLETIAKGLRIAYNNYYSKF